MYAVKLYEPGVLKYEEVPVPRIADDEVLVSVKMIGICGSDIPRALYKGAYHKGITLGHEFSGQIVECGAKVQGFEEGNRVTIAPLIPCYDCEYCKEGLFSLCESYNYYGSRTDGAMANFIKVKAGNLLKLPNEVSYEAGAMVDPAANAVHGLWRGNVSKGDTVVVAGLGAIGLFAVQIAKEMGAKRVIAIDIFDEKLAVAKEVGADLTINSKTEDPIAILADQSINCVLDTSGSPIAQNQAVAICGKRGKVVFLGISNEELILSKAAVDRLLRYEISVTGSWNSFSNPFPGKEWTYSIELMAQGKIEVEPLISHRFPIEETPEVFQKIKKKQLVFNKILIQP